MKIAIVNQWFPPDYGGIAMYNAYVARGYAELGHQVTMVTARTSPDQAAASTEGGVRVLRIDRWIEPYRLRRAPLIGRHVRTARHLYYSARVHRVLSRLTRAGEVDIVEFAEINAEGIIHLLRGAGTPAVVRCHTPHVLLDQTVTEDRGFDMKLMARIESAFVRRASAVTAPSAHLARAVEREMRLPADTVRVIPNPIDTQEFSPAPSALQHRVGSPLTILYAGRLGREKGVFVLAEALAELARGDDAGTPPAWRAIFAGSDRPSAGGSPNQEELARFFAARGLSEHVELRGAVSQDELISLYRSADICVVPSIFYESFSYTSAQAMSCGKPVIASRTGGIPEVVLDGETGLITEPGNVSELAQGLRRLLDDAGLRSALGEAGRERAVQLYDYRTVARENLALYKGILLLGHVSGAARVR